LKLILSIAAFGRKLPSENRMKEENAALCRDAATRTGEGRQREWFWQSGAMDAMGRRIF